MKLEQVDVELDLPPEYYHYRDDGCEFAGSCLNCPLPKCIYDKPGDRQRRLKDHVGAVTYGLGALGQKSPRTSHSYIPEFEEELSRAQVVRLTVHDFAKRLIDFFMRQWQQLGIPQAQKYLGPPIVFLVGGYDVNEPYGALFEFFIPTNPTPKEWH